MFSPPPIHLFDYLSVSLLLLLLIIWITVSRLPQQNIHSIHVFCINSCSCSSKLQLNWFVLVPESCGFPRNSPKTNRKSSDLFETQKCIYFPFFSPQMYIFDESLELSAFYCERVVCFSLRSFWFSFFWCFGLWKVQEFFAYGHTAFSSFPFHSLSLLPVHRDRLID